MIFLWEISMSDLRYWVLPQKENTCTYIVHLWINCDLLSCAIIKCDIYPTNWDLKSVNSRHWVLCAWFVWLLDNDCWGPEIKTRGYKWTLRGGNFWKIKNYRLRNFLQEVLSKLVKRVWTLKKYGLDIIMELL